MKNNKKIKNKTKKFFTNNRLRHLFEALIAVVIVIGISAVLPSSSPYSVRNLLATNKSTTAPVVDTITGNYSVAGEASSSSILVKYKSSVNETAKANINKRVGAVPKRKIDKLNVDVLEISTNESVDTVIGKYKVYSEVEYAEPNYLAKGFLTPNDTLFSKQWHLQKIEAPKAWDVSQGGYGPIAVVDTGIASAQSDLSGWISQGYNFVAGNTNANDDNGHGTHVAGIISASSNNGNGVASIGFKGTLLPVKVLDSNGSGTYANVASGIIYAADQGSKVINMSLGGSSSSLTLKNAVSYAQSKGSIIVAAAGNNGNSTAVYPAVYPGVIAVSASTQDDTLASFSSYGSHIYVSAPGTGIISTYNNGGYATLSGTSMATPVVSGLIGLALSRGTTSVTTVIADLKTASDKVGPYPYDQNGWNQYFGYGRINAARLLGATTTIPSDTTTTPQDKTEKPKSTSNRSPNSPNYSGSQSVPGNIQFDTVIQGEVNSIDLARSVIVLKVKTSSANLQLDENNLIDLYITQDTLIKSGNSILKVDTLTPGRIFNNIKAQWKDNKLTAQEIIVKK